MIPHDVLGIPPDATPEEIRRRYHELILECHPDRSDSPDAASRTQEITEAYKKMMGRVEGGRSSSHRAKKQAAKYHRKNPKRKDRAGRREARKAAKAKKPRRVKCNACGGDGTVTRKRKVFDPLSRTEDVECWRCAGRGYTISQGATNQRKPRRPEGLRSRLPRRPVAIAMMLAVISLGAAWYLGFVPAGVDDAILDAIGSAEDAVPASVKDDILNAIYGTEGEALDDVADVPGTVPDTPAVKPTVKVPDSPLDRTIYPDGTTHGSRRTAQEP